MRLFLLTLIFFPLLVLAQSPPPQPLTGPGGSSYNHGSVIFSDFTSFLNPNGYWLFEPDAPKPDSANLVVFNHGYGVWNPGPYAQWIAHLVRKGNVVIFPKYQASDASAPSGYTGAMVNGIIDGISELQTGTGRVRPKTENFTIIGHSYGGVLSSNIAIEHASYGVPKPKAILLCEPGTGGFSGGRLASYASMDTSYNLLIIVGDGDVVVGNAFGREIMDSTTIPTAHKNYITQFKDNYGAPNIQASHNEPLAKNNTYDGGSISSIITSAYVVSKEDAVDYYCYWKLADALMNCTFDGTDCDFAFGDTPNQRYMGEWSDSTPVIELVVEPSAVGLNEWTEEQLKMYPNPAENRLNFMSKIRGTYQIHDITGKLVMQERFKRTYINVKSLPSGIYSIKIQSDHKIIHQKFIKN
ncbi:MAG: T9SS type A sorting domain-containing protein [Flavobacteriales bacterium]|nr:T9SS type A sorting domain-containing protein [Flavobacteriales bacterium]